MTVPMTLILIAAVLLAIWAVCGLVGFLDDCHEVGADEPGRVLPGLGADTFPREWILQRPYDWAEEDDAA